LQSSTQPQSSIFNQGLTFEQFCSLASLQPIWTVDTESDPDTDEFLGISIAFDGISDGFYFGVECQEEEYRLTPDQCEQLRDLFRTRDALVFHNAAYDLKRLQRKFAYRHEGRFYDTMLMIHWIDENKQNYSLDAQCRYYGLRPKNRSPQMQFIIDNLGWKHVPFKLMHEYSANDAYITHQLFRTVLPEFQAQEFDNELWHVYECKFIWIVANMIELGIKIDLEFCVREMIKGQNIMEQMRKELYINPGSSNGLESLLIKQLGLPVVKLTPGGKPSFDKDAMKQYEEILEFHNDDRAKKILRYRGWQKTVSSNYKAYCDLRDKNNVLHPGYKIHGTETGRMSCEKPNLQQIPKSSAKEWNGSLKQAFVPRDGYELWEFDYSQLEFRLTCAYAEQHDLLEIFNDESRDIFSEMAERMGWLRQNVKTLVYLILFGGGANRARTAFNLKTLEEGKELVEEFHRTYPGIRKVSRKAQNLATARGFVKYWTGRRRHFPKGSKYYRAFNSIIQGGEAEIVKRAMIKLDEEVCNEACRMVLQVHDSVVFEIAVGQADRYIPKIKKAMESVDYNFGVDFRVDYKKWGEAA
jgi:DNA polymerase I